ncbi:Lrp/AsnC ligand binding domain-containing protein [Bacteriovorax sp. BSW11_IV]|uniref:Lrp/AsnC ligand binding domain-containing protein n=1 Tax=Bacteriovorax sp. BSW11_IV TaxID=1353529 RepID=UPI00054E45AC
MRCKVTHNYEIDNLDLKILGELQKDARKPFLEIARKLSVSGGTIHQRVEKLKEMGVILGTRLIVDHKKLGQGVCVMLGIHLHNAKDIQKVISKLQKIDEVVETHYTTGSFGLMIKVYVRDIDHYHQFLVGKLQAIDEVLSTESFICLSSPIERELKLIK